MTKKWHPDKTGGRTGEKFKEIVKVNEVLSDSSKRVLWETSKNGYSSYDDFGGQRSGSWSQS